MTINVRYFCPKFFRQTFHEYAAQSIQDSFWAALTAPVSAPKAKTITPPSGSGLQMDAGDLEVLADSHSLQRGYLSGKFAEEGIVLTQVRR